MRRGNGKGIGGDGGDMVLRNARIMADPAAAVSAPQTITVRGGRITAIGDDPGHHGDGIPSLDLDGRLVTAGFWNAHVHFTEPVWHRGDAAAIQAAMDDMALARGFVGVVDLASDPRVTSRLIGAVASGVLRGPHILTAGPGIRPWRGIQYYIKADLPLAARWSLPQPLTALGARLAVRRQAGTGAHVIKLFTGSYVAPGRVRPMRLAVARAAVTAAHRRGLRVFAHPSDKRGVEIAVLAGVDALAHVPDRPAGTAPMLDKGARDGLRMVATLHMFAATVSADAGYLDAIAQALRGFRAAGGRVMFGTDVGYLPDRATLPEFAAMAGCDMSARDIIASLTTEIAAFFGWHDRGAVAVGHRADLTVLDQRSGDPAPADLAAVCAVVCDGRLRYSTLPRG